MPAKDIGFKTLFMRGLCERCPNCGQAPLFRAYLKQVDACPVCHEAWGLIRADDGPAWLTILLVGHIVVPLALEIESNPPWPAWASLLVWPGITVPLVLAVLPRAKAVFIALIWKYCPPRMKAPPHPAADKSA